ncbi:MAG TPA: hypothetical protein DCX64_04840 [Gammaproteobacteria bacterium]|nr:hypothetical protein [Gammaproteobacteria bacterium]|tara:strand:- start:9 stop:599 length:591 start_codon:yes stop_codon:yes gene_type:complete
MDKKQTLHQKIIDATLTEISTNGIENLTAKNISKRAKTSTGIIYHHFDTMEGLVFATYSELINELAKIRKQVRKKYPSDPVKRLKETMLVNFDKEFVNNTNRSAWTQLWASSVCNNNINELVNQYYKSLYSDIESDFKEFCDDASSRQNALSIISMIHGYWIELIITKNATVDECIDAANNCIDKANRVERIKSLI